MRSYGAELGGGSGTIMRSAAACALPLQRLVGGFHRPKLLGDAGTPCALINNYASTKLILCSWVPWLCMAACWTDPFCDEQ
jgi:hypothetical protein